MAQDNTQFKDMVAQSTAVQNPFGGHGTAEGGPGGALASYQSREIAEAQAALLLAKHYPRNQKQAMDRILQACTRPGLANAALYEYSRGGTAISGPSIRLAEAMAQNWGNLQFGLRELNQSGRESTVQAYAWDLETNTRQERVFQVPHVRFARGKRADLNGDPRDVYELIASQGQRRVRACILGVIPEDVVAAAVAQVHATLHTNVELTPERLRSMVEAFADYGVTQDMIEARIQRRLDAMTPALFLQLSRIYNSLKDGMSHAGDWFEPAADRSVESRMRQAVENAQSPQPAAESSVEEEPETTASDTPQGSSPPAGEENLFLREETLADITGTLNTLGISKTALTRKMHILQVAWGRSSIEELQDIPVPALQAQLNFVGHITEALNQKALPEDVKTDGQIQSWMVRERERLES